MGRAFWMSGRRRAAAVALLLIAVPALLQIFPESADWSVWLRAAIAVAWVVAALLIVFRTVDRELALDEEMEERRAERVERKRKAMEETLTWLLDSKRSGVPDHYSFTVYLYDKKRDRLGPILPGEPADAFELRSFAPGRGATGLAFQRAKTEGAGRVVVVVNGDAVSSGEYGLTPGQQQYFEGFRSVAATAIFIDRLEPVGVLTAISRIEDRFFDDEGNRAHLLRLMSVTGEVLYATINPERAT